jgi:hypothetical protein
LYRINLDKLRSMCRKSANFGDNALALDFEDEYESDTRPDLPMCQSDTPPSQSDTPRGVDLVPPGCQSGTQSVIDPLKNSIERASEATLTTEEPPSEAAREFVRALSYGRHGMPTAVDVDRLACLIDAATVSGLTLPELRAHSQAAIGRARDAVVPYLAGALEPDRLPVPRPRPRLVPQAVKVPTAPPAAPVGELTAEELIARGLDPRFLPSRARKGA